MFACYPLISRYLAGTTARGLYEARLGREAFPGEVHVFSPAYREEEFQALLGLADHFVFNSPSQLRKYAQRAQEAGKQVGLRVNPECSTQEGHAIYDPCAPGSRLGTTLANFDESLLPLLDLSLIHIEMCIRDSVCSEFVMCYPPGIPILAPGERITPKIVEYIQYAKEKGCSMTGPEDPDIRRLNVLKGVY